MVSVVAEPEPADVYNLTVAGQPEYFANGLLVHNCADALRYLLVNLGSGPEFVIFDTVSAQVVPATFGPYAHAAPDFQTSPWWEQPAPADGGEQDPLWF